MLRLVPSGWASGDTDPSGLSTIEPERPAPPAASTTLTVMLAAGLVEVANTGRAAFELASTVTSMVLVTGDGGESGTFVPAVNDAHPPAGCGSAIVMWKVRC